jgi:hypothetical protein
LSVVKQVFGGSHEADFMRNKNDLHLPQKVTAAAVTAVSYS